MRRHRSNTIQNSLWLGACLAALTITSAPAADWYTGAPGTEDRDNWLVTVDASTSVTSTKSAFVNAGATIALRGTLDESGPRARVEGMFGGYEKTLAGGTKIHATQTEGAVLGGYEWIGPTTKITGLAGVSLRDTSLSAPDPGNPVAGTSLGLKVAMDIYARPTEQTMVSAFGSLTTNDKAYFARLKAGYRIGSDLYIGPEVAVLGNTAFSQWRVGAHLTGLQLGPLQASISAGILSDQTRKSGAYTSVDLRASF